MNSNDRRQQALRELITAHLQRNPLAADTAEGIVKCWLPEDGFEDAQDYINAVLREMVQEGILVAHVLPDGETLYAGAASAR